MAKQDSPVPASEDEGLWRIEAGVARTLGGGTPKPFGGGNTEELTYSNPFGLEIERVWFDGKVVYAVEQGEIDLGSTKKALQKYKLAQEYQVVYEVKLDSHGKLLDGAEPERVPGQYNIYDSVPGMEKYSPLWQFNYVVVPRDYAPNALRSEADCLKSGYPITRSTIIEN